MLKDVFYLEVTIIPAAKQKTTTWAGGKTTQLLIFPPEATLGGRDFLVRVSSATVELERSDFTTLPGVTRLIMPLSGTMKLEHLADDGSSPPGADPTPFGVHRFDGGWQTVSHGTCTDFNLMLAQGWEGEMKAVSDGEEVACGPGQVLCLYVLEPLEIALPGEKHDLLPGDALCVELPMHSGQMAVSIKGDGDGLAVMANAWKI